MLRHTRHHIPYAALLLLAVVIAFVSVIFYHYPFIPRAYSNAFTESFRMIKSAIGISSGNQAHEYASITEFGSTSEQIIILEPEMEDPSLASSTASSTEGELQPDTLKPYEPSPESQWSKLYLDQMGINPSFLQMNISYVREWQQTGGLQRDLKSGSKGTDVKLAQYALSMFDSKFPQSNVSSTFGPKTKTAVIDLQNRLKLPPTGIIDGELRFFLDAIYFKQLCPDANPEQDKSYENVGRRISVPNDYIPSDLIRLPRTVRTVGVMCLSREPAKRLEDMFAAAKSAGHDLAVFSAYRSSHTQELLTEYYLRTMGQAGLAGVAEAGHSEHQLGTTIDISGKSIKYAGPSNAFGTAPEGKWLAENSYKFGFVLSYPKGKENTTGYIYEPWHFRYVGVDTARDIFEEGLTIQEYFNLVKGR